MCLNIPWEYEPPRNRLPFFFLINIQHLDIIVLALCCRWSGPYYPRICFLVPLSFKTDLWSLSRKISASDLADMKLQETRQSPTLKKINQEWLNMTQRCPAINNQDNHPTKGEDQSGINRELRKLRGNWVTLMWALAHGWLVRRL